MPKNRYKKPNAAPPRPRPKVAHAATTVPASADAAPAPNARPLNPVAFGIGLLAIAVAIGASLMLALDKFDILKLPGCGAGSGCGAAAASPLGNIPIPGTDHTWPLAFAGLAYFIAVGAAWIVNRRGISTALRLVLLLGAFGSLFYITVMIANPDYLCAYCLTTHVANFVVVIIAMAAGGFSHRSEATLWTGATAMIVATSTLFIAERASSVAAIEKGNREEADSIAMLLEENERAKLEAERTQGATVAAGQGETPTDSADWRTNDRLTHTGRRGFTGNYVRGAENASIRIVVFSDYQCEDCARVHHEVEDLLARFPNASFSHKHFPFAEPCNPGIGPDSGIFHPNACWASRAAEAAGLLHGPEGFWQMHDWLFNRGGGFTNDELQTQLRAFGWDPQEFDRTMQGPLTLEIVQADAQEGKDRGLYYTPMMFVNGVQIRGFRNKEVLTRAVAAVAAQNPPPGDATQDFPAGRLEKYVNDYFDDNVTLRYVRLGTDRFKASLGPDNAPADIQVFLSYKNPNAKAVQARIDAIVEKHPDNVRVTYRNFPVTQAAFPKVWEKVDEGEQTYTMAKAAEAAGQLGGLDAFMAIHRFNLQNQASWSIDALRTFAAKLGLDPDALVAKMESQEVIDAIQSEGNWLLSIRKASAAAVFVNGKHVDHLMKEEPVFEGIVDRLIEMRGQ